MTNEEILATLLEHSIRDTARLCGVHRSRVQRLMDGQPALWHARRDALRLAQSHDRAAAGLRATEEG